MTGTAKVALFGYHDTVCALPSAWNTSEEFPLATTWGLETCTFGKGETTGGFALKTFLAAAATATEGNAFTLRTCFSRFAAIAGAEITCCLCIGETRMFPVFTAILRAGTSGTVPFTAGATARFGQIIWILISSFSIIHFLLLLLWLVF